MTDSMSLPGPSGKGVRTKLGCFTCRARKVKCDQTRPTCQTCTRLNLDCTYTKPDKQLNIPRLRRGRKRRTSENGATSSEIGGEEDRRSSINTMPDLWPYQQQQPQSQYQYQPRGSLDHGQMRNMGMGMGMGMGMDEGLASSTYLSSLLRPPPRRESMPIMLPSSYMGGMGMAGRDGRYGSPTPNLFNGYQMGNHSSSGNSLGLGAGSGSGGCTGEIPRSITPSSTSMTTPQPWDLPQSEMGGNGYQMQDLEIQGQGQGQGQAQGSGWNQSVQSFEYQEPLEYNEWGLSNTRTYATHPPTSRSSYPSIYEQNHHQSPNPEYVILPPPTQIGSGSNSNPLNQSQSQSHSTSTSSSTSHSYSTSQSQSQSQSNSNSNIGSSSMGWPSATPQGYHYEEPKGYPPV